MRILILFLLCSVAGISQTLLEVEANRDEQDTKPRIGARPKEAAPEVLEQMKRSVEKGQLTSQGFTVAELDAFRHLREQDQRLYQKLLETNQSFKELKEFVESLDYTIDQRLLGKAIEDIKQLQEIQKHREEEDKEARERNQKIQSSIETGTIMLLIGMILHWIKWLLIDPQRRRALINNISENVKTIHCDEENRHNEPPESE